MPSAPHQGRDGTALTRTAGAYSLVASARPIEYGRAKRLAERGEVDTVVVICNISTT